MIWYSIGIVATWYFSDKRLKQMIKSPWFNFHPSPSSLLPRFSLQHLLLGFLSFGCLSALTPNLRLESLGRGVKVVIFMGNMDFIKNDGKFMGISWEYHGNVNSDCMPNCLYFSCFSSDPFMWRPCDSTNSRWSRGNITWQIARHGWKVSGSIVCPAWGATYNSNFTMFNESLWYF